MLAASIWLVSVGVEARAVVIYDQPAQSPVVSSRISQFVAGTFPFQTFDNFTFGETTTVKRCALAGVVFQRIHPTTAPPANATGFGANFYTDSGGGLPGAVAGQYSFFPASNAGETFVGTQAAPGLGVTLSIYNYDVNLPTPFVAQAGQQYWLSVFAFEPGASPVEAQWGWNGGIGGDGISYQNPGGGLVEISPNVGDGLKDQAAAVWAFESAGLAATSIPSVNLTP